MAGSPSFTTAPSETIKKQFSASASVSGGGDTTSPEIPPVNTADLAQQPIPQNSLGASDIEAFYKPILDQIQNEQTPLSRPVPAEISPTGTFLGLLAGNLASTFSENPAFAQQAHQYMAEQEKFRKATIEQNYSDQLANDAAKRNKLITIRGQILEKTLDESIKSGDLERANIASKNLFAFQEGLKRESDKQSADREKALIQTTAAEARKTQAAKSSLSASEEKTAAAKPMTTKEYLQGVNDINRNKNIPNEGRGFFFGAGPRTDTTATSHEAALEQYHASAILNGEPTVQKAAKQNLKRVILTRLGLIGKTPDAAAKERVKAALEQYGLTPKDVL